MRVTRRTLSAVAGIAIALLTTPASASPLVRLVASIRPLAPEAGLVRYAVTVRPEGGTAREASLVLGTLSPAAWGTPVQGCLANSERTAMVCDLGNLPAGEDRTLILAARTGGAPVPIVAEAAAANAPRPAIVTSPDTSPQTDESPPAQSPEPSAEPSQQPEPTMSPEVVRPSPGGAASGDPSPDLVRPHVTQRTVGAVRPTVKHGVSPASGVRIRKGPPAGAGAGHRRGAPVTPHKHVHPTVPAPAAAPPVPPEAPPLPIVPGGSAGGPGATAPDLPQLAAPQMTSSPSPNSGISELTTLSPAGAMQAGRASWATLIAIAVVAEAGLLWLATGLTVLRRKRTREGGVHRLRTPLWPRMSKILR
jgi:hypothetical protein